MTINEMTTSFDGLFVIEEFLDWLAEDWKVLWLLGEKGTYKG